MEQGRGDLPACKCVSDCWLVNFTPFGPRLVHKGVGQCEGVGDWGLVGAGQWEGGGVLRPKG